MVRTLTRSSPVNNLRELCDQLRPPSTNKIGKKQGKPRLETVRARPRRLEELPVEIAEVEAVSEAVPPPTGSPDDVAEAQGLPKGAFSARPKPRGGL